MQAFQLFISQNPCTNFKQFLFKGFFNIFITFIIIAGMLTKSALITYYLLFIIYYLLFITSFHQLIDFFSKPIDRKK